MFSEDTDIKANKVDRVLGDEWKDWDGVSDSLSQGINESSRTFFIYLFILALLTLAFSFFFLYLITPRLLLLNTTVSNTVTALVFISMALLLFWYSSLVIAVVTKKRIFFGRSLNQKLLTFIVDKTANLGLKFGISRDRMANSFLKVFNVIIQKDNKNDLPLRPIIILPRCLEKDAREKALGLAKKYGVESFIVGGGEAAKAKIKEKNPPAVIGVACERDLLSGIKEISARIPVVGIANKRPKGPCKETCIDIDELERAIKYFLQV